MFFSARVSVELVLNSLRKSVDLKMERIFTMKKTKIVNIIGGGFKSEELLPVHF